MPDKAPTDVIRNAMQVSGDYNAKLMEFAAANTHAAFEYIRKLHGAKSPSEVIELTSSHMREQTDVLTQQAKELAELAAFIREQDNLAWDREIEADFSPGGKHHPVLAEVDAQIDAGNFKPLP